MKILVNDFIKIELNLPEEMNANEFLGLIEDVGRFVRKNNIGSDNALSLPKDWTEEDDTALIEMVENQKSRNYIAKELNREIGAVYTRISKLRKEGLIKKEME